MMWTEKYRPQVFDDVVGQDKIVTTVKGMIERDHDIPNIRMIGEPGTGKTTIAYLIGKELLKEFFEMNFTEYNASNERGADTIREVIKSSMHQPMFSDVKIIFLDESDGLTPQAQNMLRKPLEERGSTRFILSANNDIFSKPIRSRCVVLEFGKIGSDAIRKRLEHIAESEGLDLNGEIKDISGNCDGDLRFAINELQRVAASGGGKTDGAELLESIRNMEVTA
ncbi:MAG: AAA family ATPase [Chloroflexota bacterium]|nr:AAA family ATPase [Chloroflexota bacterium]